MKRTLILAASAVACIIAGGAAFAVAGHLPLWHGLYCAVGTASTVGCDVAFTTAAGRVVSVAVMLTAIPLLGATFASLTAMHVHRHVVRTLNRQDDTKGSTRD